MSHVLTYKRASFLSVSLTAATVALGHSPDPSVITLGAVRALRRVPKKCHKAAERCKELLPASDVALKSSIASSSSSPACSTTSRLGVLLEDLASQPAGTGARLLGKRPELLLLLDDGELTVTVSPDLSATAVDAYGCLAEVVDVFRSTCESGFIGNLGSVIASGFIRLMCRKRPTAMTSLTQGLELLNSQNADRYRMHESK